MRAKKNLIHGLTLDVTYDGANETGETLADWLRAALLPVIDEALAEQDLPGKVRRIARLEIDLGEIPREQAETELARRLQEQLREALAQLAVVRTKASKKEQTARGANVDEAGEHLLNFLRNGRLPWEAASDQHMAHEHLLHRVLAARTAKRVLKAVVQDEQMLIRMVRQFSCSTLSEVAARLGRKVADPLNATEADWLALLAGASASPVQPQLAAFLDWQRRKVDLPDQSLTLAELHQWLIWWLMHDATLVNQDCSLMLEAIGSQCKQARDPVQFMKAVLATLRDGATLDLEELARQTDQPAAIDAIASLTSQAAVKNFIAQHLTEDKELATLNSAQLHQLVRAWVTSGQDESPVFLMAIENHALQAPDVHIYFRRLVQDLLAGQTIDLENLSFRRVQEAQEAVHIAVPVLEASAPREASPLPLKIQHNLPQRLASAILQADLTSLEIYWPEITRYHADILLEAAQRYLRRPQERANLVARSSPEMLLAMLHAISPSAGAVVGPILQYAELCNNVLAVPKPLAEFCQHVLRFAFDHAINSEDVTSIDLLRTLHGEQSQDEEIHLTAYAWHAILPSAKALDRALFGERYRHAVQNEEDAPEALHALLVEELSNNYPELLQNSLQDRDVSETVASMPAQNPAPAIEDAPRELIRAANIPVPDTSRAESLLAVLLMRSSHLSAVERLSAELMLQRLLKEQRTQLSGALETALCQPATIARLSDIAPGPVLAQLLVHLQPELAAQLPAALRTISAITKIPDIPALQTKTTWQIIYQTAFVNADPITPAEFIRTLVRNMSGDTDTAMPQPLSVPLVPAQTMRALLQPLTAPQPASPTSPMHETGTNEDTTTFTGDANIRNAGMVIIATYAQRLFSILELTKDGEFISDEAAQRAVHLLQYAITAQTTTPEYQLVLNKLLCGIHGGQPIMRSIDISDKEKDTIEQMLNGVIAHWKALGKTSISGLRQTFLQREGHLYFEEDAWHLKIPTATFDMLLDRLPWSFAMIKFPWMQHALHVTWR